MDEQIKTVYQAILLETGFTRMELTSVLSSNSAKRLAQKILVKVLARIVSEDEIQYLTRFKPDEVKQIQMSELSSSEANIYKLVWRSYIGLMDEQLATTANVA